MIQNKDELQYNCSRKDIIAAVRNDCENTLNGKKKIENTDKQSYTQRFFTQVIVCIIIFTACLSFSSNKFSSNNKMISFLKQVNNIITDSSGIHEAEDYINKFAASVIHKE